MSYMKKKLLFLRLFFMSFMFLLSKTQTAIGALIGGCGL